MDTRQQATEHGTVGARLPDWRALVAAALFGAVGGALTLTLGGRAYVGDAGDAERGLFVLRWCAGGLLGGVLCAFAGSGARGRVGSRVGAMLVGALCGCLYLAPSITLTLPYTRWTGAVLLPLLVLFAASGAVVGAIARGIAGEHAAREATGDGPPLLVSLLVALGKRSGRDGRRERERERIRARPFPRAWLDAIRRNVPLYDRLGDADREALRGLVQVFLAEKRFEGCNGLEITDEIRVTVAAQACMLLLHTDADVFPTLRSIVVYPDAFAAPGRRMHGGIMSEEREPLLGQSWRRGEVVLSWRDARAGARDSDDGANVVLHEFAHQLDQLSGTADGIPELRTYAAHRAWARLLEQRFAEIQDERPTGLAAVMDRYGATDRAEFFAVATETFFERPAALRLADPEMYAALSDFYGLDLAPDGAAGDAT